MYQIIDSHVHVGTGEAALGPKDPEQSFALWRVRAAEAGIHRAVLIAAPVRTYAQANNVVAELAARDPERWLWYVFINPVTDSGRIEDIVAAAHAKRACGIKIHWTDGLATDEVARTAARHRMPVLFDPGGDVASVDRLAARHPAVPWIVPHLSSFGDNWQAQKRLIDLLVRRPNVFTDTAGVRYFDLLVEAVARAGAHKVLFGSDGPYLHPAPELAKIRALHLAPTDQELVLHGNVVRLTRPSRLLLRRHNVHLHVAQPLHNR